MTAEKKALEEPTISRMRLDGLEDLFDDVRSDIPGDMGMALSRGLSLSEAVHYYGKKKKEVRRQISEGKIPAVRFANAKRSKWRVFPDGVPESLVDLIPSADELKKVAKEKEEESEPTQEPESVADSGAEAVASAVVSDVSEVESRTLDIVSEVALEVPEDLVALDAGKMPALPALELPLVIASDEFTKAGSAAFQAASTIADANEVIEELQSDLENANEIDEVPQPGSAGILPASMITDASEIDKTLIDCAPDGLIEPMVTRELIDCAPEAVLSSIPDYLEHCWNVSDISEPNCAAGSCPVVGLAIELSALPAVDRLSSSLELVTGISEYPTAQGAHTLAQTQLESANSLCIAHDETSSYVEAVNVSFESEYTVEQDSSEYEAIEPIAEFFFSTELSCEEAYADALDDLQPIFERCFPQLDEEILTPPAASIAESSFQFGELSEVTITASPATAFQLEMLVQMRSRIEQLETRLNEAYGQIGYLESTITGLEDQVKYLSNVHHRPLTWQGILFLIPLAAVVLALASGWHL